MEQSSKKKLCATCGVSDPAMAAICVLPSHHCEFKHRNGTNGQIFGADAQDSKTTNRAILPKPQEKKVKTAIVAMLLATATIMLTDVATPTPAAAGWCIEACGLVRQQRQQQTREVVCTTVRRGNRTETVCTSN